MARADLHLATCRYALDLLLPEDLPALAVDLLVAGHDVPALVELAGLHATETDAAHRLWRRALEQLDVHLPTSEVAVLAVAKEISRDLLRGALDERGALRQVTALGYAHLIDDPRLHPFLYADCEWDGCADEETLWISMVRAAAQELLAGDPPAA